MEVLKENISNKPFFLTVVFLLVPTIKFGVYRFYPAELFSLFMIVVFNYGLLKGYFKDYKLTKIFNSYFIYYLLIVISLVIIHSNYNSGFSAIFRTIFTTVGFVFLFEHFAIKRFLNYRFLTRISFFLIIPPLIGIFQYLGLFGAIELIIKLYDPVIQTMYDMDIYDFLGLRVPSIFKDYFHAGIFYMLNGLWFLILFKKTRKNYLLFFYAITLAVSFFTSRTSFYFLLFLILFFLIKNTFSKKGIILLFFTTVSLFFFSDTILRYLNNLNIDEYYWALELFLSEGQTSSSGILIATLENGFSFVFNDLGFEDLFFPKPINFNVTDYTYYSDSFYIQEIVRAGFFGLLIYFTFIVRLIKQFHFKYGLYNSGIFLILILFFVNVKGGNVFFLERSNLLLSLLFVYSYYEKDINYIR